MELAVLYLYFKEQFDFSDKNLDVLNITKYILCHNSIKTHHVKPSSFYYIGQSV